jgi:hypothetical protein
VRPVLFLIDGAASPQTPLTSYVKELILLLERGLNIEIGVHRYIYNDVTANILAEGTKGAIRP